MTPIRTEAPEAINTEFNVTAVARFADMVGSRAESPTPTTYADQAAEDREKYSFDSRNWRVCSSWMLQELCGRRSRGSSPLTETSMMFMTPMPPTSSEMAAMPVRPMVRTSVIWVKLERSCSWVVTEKSAAPPWRAFSSAETSLAVAPTASGLLARAVIWLTFCVPESARASSTFM